MRSWMTVPQTIVDTVFKALAPAIPEQVAAAHHADLCIVTVYGFQASEFFFTHIGPLGGGWGAKQNEDGVSVTVCINDGDTHNTPSEQLEAKFSHLVVEKYGLITDSGGPGRQRGGLGAEMVLRTRGDLMLNSKIERTHCRPWGLDGGLEATGNEIRVRRAGAPMTFANAKASTVALKAGDTFTIRSGGGGGFGSPLERPAEAVREDVKQGYVSRDAAHDRYGVVLHGATPQIDQAATRARRRELSSAKVPETTGGSS
jgi:N-methylhydantoinase B